MDRETDVGNRVLGLVAFLLALAILPYAQAGLHLGAETLVVADGLPVDVIGYSVPCFADWNDDDLPDLIVGEGGGVYAGKVRVYLNAGTSGEPLFHDNAFYAQSKGADLSVPGSGCLGAFPRMVDWNGDELMDLLVGQADGKIKIFLNIGTIGEPTFDRGAFVQVGPTGGKTDISVGSRATPSVVDWNNDGLKDMISGGMSGRIYVYLNTGSNQAPDFQTTAYARQNGVDLIVNSGRSSPCAGDFNNDDRKDLICGNTNGELWLYPNVGTDAEPIFGDAVQVEAADVPIDLAGTPRSRPFVCDWNADGKSDVLIGAADGQVHLYRGHCAGDVNHDGQTGIADLAALLAAYGSTAGEPAYDPGLDFDADGDVDLSDLAYLLSLYGCHAVVS